MKIDEFYDEVVDSYKKDDPSRCSSSYCFLKIFKKYYPYAFSYNSLPNNFYNQAAKELRKCGLETSSGCLENIIYIAEILKIPIKKIINFVGFSSQSAYCKMCYLYKNKEALDNFIKFLIDMEIE